MHTQFQIADRIGTLARSPGTSAAFLSLLLGCALAYNGIGHSLQWLSAAGIVLLMWVATTAARLDMTRVKLSPGWLPMFVLAYLAWLLINPWVSAYPYVSSVTGKQLALLPLVFIGWLLLPDKDKAWRITTRSLPAIGLALALWGIADFLVFSTRSHGPLIDANAYGALANLFLVPAIAQFLRDKPSQDGLPSIWIRLVFVVALSLALCMSGSRGALISLLAILPILLWLGRHSPSFYRRAGIVILVLASAYLATSLTSVAAHRGLEKLLPSSAEQDGNIQARLQMWRATWKIFENANPWIGTGLGTYKNYYAAHRESSETVTSGNLAHNDYLQALQEGGAIQLAFLLTLTVLAPLLLVISNARIFVNRAHSNESAGLLLGVLAVSLHALVNFIHYVAPISVLTGLYLARSWEMGRQERDVCFVPPQLASLKPALLKTIAISGLALPMIALVADGAIFKLTSSSSLAIAPLTEQTFNQINLALVIRPENPRPRILLIQKLLDAASGSASQALRERFLQQAELESMALVRVAPGLASGRFFLGKVRTLRGAPDDLLAARQDLEYAVAQVPPSMAMRLELVRLYRQLGLPKNAIETVREAKRWYMIESDYPSLAAFAKEARAIAQTQNDTDEADFWSWVYSRLATLDHEG